MPNFTIPLEGGGEIHQNGATYADAVANAAAAGAKPQGSGGGGTPSSTTSSGGGGGGAPVYQTVNGPKTVAQMEAELKQAGWPGPIPGTEGPGAIANAYQQTTKGSVTPINAQPGGTPAGTPPAPTDKGANLNAAQLLLNQAQQAAYQAYLSARLNLDTDQLAFQKATQAFNNTVVEAGLTGTYQGKPTLAAQEEQNRTTQGYLQLISGLRGPADYGQYLRVIGSTPGGLKDLVSSAAGQYQPATGATTGAPTQAATLGSLVGDVGKGATSFADYTAQTQGLPAPNQIAPASWNAYTDTQKKMLLGAYESRGYVPQDVLDLYQQSLPKYGTQPGTVGAIKL